MKPCAFAIGIMLIAGCALGAGIDGNWSLGDGVDAEPYFTFQVDGEKLAGTSIGSPDGKNHVPIKDGKINGKNISFQVVGDLFGKELKLNYKGVIVSDDEIRLTYSIEGIGDLGQKLTAKRIKKEALAPPKEVAPKNGFSITGSVVDVQGRGIANAHIWLNIVGPDKHSQVPQSYSAEARTNIDGSFKLQNILPDAEWSIQVDHPNYVTHSKQVKKISQKDDGMKIVLSRGIKISAKVLYEKSMTPASDCWVRLEKPNDSQMPWLGTAKPNPKGEVIFDRVNPGDYRVAVFSGNEEFPSMIDAEWADAKSEVKAEEGKDVSITLYVQPPGFLEAHVRLESSSASIDRLSIKAKEAGTGLAREFDVAAKADNTFLIGPLRARSHTFLASIKDAESLQTDSVVILPNETKRIELVFHAGAKMHGRIVDDATKQPIEGAKVTIYPYPSGGYLDVNIGPAPGTIGVSSAVSGKNGAFVSSGLSQGKPLRIDVSHPSYAFWSSGPQYQSVPPDGQVVVGLMRSANLTLELMRNDGGPLRGIPVHLTSSIRGVAQESKLTDPQGHVAFRNIPPGSYEFFCLAAEAPGKKFGVSARKQISLMPGESKNERINLNAE